MTQGSDQRLDLIAQVIGALGSPAFPAALAAVLRAVTSYNYTVIFGYRGAARPVDLHDDFPLEKRKVFVTDYQDGPYLLDPFYLAAMQPVPPGIYRMRDLAPDRFYQGEYFRNYYVQTGLAEEIGIFTDLPDGSVVVTSLMREERPFSRREIRALESILKIVQAASRKHWASLAENIGQARGGARETRLHGQIERSFQTFGGDLLTPRERQVVEFTLKGHSAEAIGRLLAIRPGTVSIHRRNVYSKLRISSQGELFSRFIQALGGKG